MATEIWLRPMYEEAPRVDMGTVGDAQEWWTVPLPPCPECGGELEWAEAGNVPGARKCGKGHLFLVMTRSE